MTKCRYAYFVAMMYFLSAIQVGAEDLAIKQIAARTELHPISSLTISDEQFTVNSARQVFCATSYPGSRPCELLYAPERVSSPVYSRHGPSSRC